MARIKGEIRRMKHKLEPVLVPSLTASLSAASARILCWTTTQIEVPAGSRAREERRLPGSLGPIWTGRRVGTEL
eukprot:492801-Rhodomonas_salina.1